jgi:NADH:ubiquinone oxidoreductase subunit K
MGLELGLINFAFAALGCALLTRQWLLVPFVAAFEVLWSLLCYTFALQSLAYNDLGLLFVAIVVLFLSAAELVLGLSTLFVIFHQQRKVLL